MNNMYADMNEYEVRNTINYNIKKHYEHFCNDLNKIINKFMALQKKVFVLDNEQLKKYNVNSKQLIEYIRLCLNNAQYMSIKDIRQLCAYIKSQHDEFKSVVGGYAIDAMINVTKTIDNLNKYLSILRNKQEQLIQHANSSEINNIEQIKELRRIINKSDNIIDSYTLIHKRLVSIAGILHAIIIL